MSLQPGEREPTPDSPRRTIYLLIFWQERPPSPDGPAVWRFRLEDVRTRRQYGFGSLEQVSAFLEDRMIGRIRSNHVDTVPQGKGETDEDRTG
jgi:hypothetical protein